MSLPEILVAPMLVVFWFGVDGSNWLFQRFQRVVLRRATPETYSPRLIWGWRLLVVALGVLWVIGLVRRFA